ncbi:MAG: mannose-1-phosphate guanylyltransferase/mannose-6-phosphate isomerase [Rhodobiaceae bacterium]|nr:mannose-1-phosphate guanylyltransferase/mannose-6-phosphate isomerase [Rhodobiaceae bacterium]
MANITPVILAGGVGSRLWPLSRSECPKQFRRFGTEKTIFQMTACRFKEAFVEAPIIVTSGEFETLIRTQLSEVGVEPSLIIKEPVGRNTAPAIIAAAICARRRDKDGALLVLPSDHLIEEGELLSSAVQSAKEASERGRLVTFGVTPTRPESGYGYIQSGEGDGPGSRRVAAFIEKPPIERAVELISDGSHLWNSGMFLLPIRPLLSECQRLVPALFDRCAYSLAKGRADGLTVMPDAALFAEIEPLSIDHAVMEKTDLASVVRLDADWTDLGSWHAVWHTMAQDAQDNACLGDVVLQDTKRSLVYSPDRLTCVAGLEDVVVVDTGDALLVTHRDASQDVKQLTERLRKDGRTELDTPAIVQRPWGTYQSVDTGPGFQVKRITVAPGGCLSLQYHHQRSEHWTVVSGVAHVLVGKVEEQLSANQSVYIPQGEVHRLENKGDQPVTLIEVQCGAYLGEDDIIRLEDVYGRTEGAQRRAVPSVAAE